MARARSLSGGLTLVLAGSWLGAQAVWGGLIGHLVGPLVDTPSATPTPVPVTPAVGGQNGPSPTQPAFTARPVTQTPIPAPVRAARQTSGR